MHIVNYEQPQEHFNKTLQKEMKNLPNPYKTNNKT